MRESLLALLALGVLGLTACGASVQRSKTSVASRAASSSAALGVPAYHGPLEPAPQYPGVHKYLGDDDGDDDHNSDENIHTFGRRAGEAQERAIAAVVRRYYAIAAQGSGARGCSMFSRAFRRTVPIAYGLHGAPYMRGSTCVAVMTRYYRHLHRQIAFYASTSKVIEARLEGERGYAVLRMHGICPSSMCIPLLRHMRIAHVLVQREAGAWKIESMFITV